MDTTKQASLNNSKLIAFIACHHQQKFQNEQANKQQCFLNAEQSKKDGDTAI
jgi:hypothetical protein